MAYTVTLHFTAGDHTYTVLREGFKLGDQVGAKGKHATQTTQLNIRSYEAAILFLQEEANLIRAELHQDGTLLFQGVVRPYQSMNARNNFEDVFSFEIMDDTEVLVNTAIPDQEEHLGVTLSWAIEHLYDLADLPETLSVPEDLDSEYLAYFNMDPGVYGNVAAMLEAMLFEYGYDYRFTANTCEIIPTTTDETPETTADIRNTLTVSRDDNWSDGVIVNYGIAGILRQIPLAHHTEDISDPQWWRNILPWSYSDSSGRVTRTVAYTPYWTTTAWADYSPKPEGFTADCILSAMNLRVPYNSYCTVHSLTPHAHSVSIDFSWDTRIDYVWGSVAGGQMPSISVYGDVIYAISGDYQEQVSGDKPDEFTLDFMRSAELAKAFAEREYKRAKTAPITYTFQSLTHYAAGSFVQITDTVTGIDVTARVITCSMDADGIYSVKAESADYIGMSVSATTLEARDYIDTGTDLTLTADNYEPGEGESCTVTASGRLLDILEDNGSEGFTFSWQLNGEDVSDWTGQTEVTVENTDLAYGVNTFVFTVTYSDTQVGQATTSVTRADAETVEVQYAIGPSYITPPEGTMLWGGEEMLWNGVNMVWDTAAYSEDVPEQERAQYIWMRTKVGDADWQYSRLTGATPWDPENLGIATSATPTSSRENLNLVAGDYFVAGDSFTEDGTTYNAGYAYVYDGSAWQEMDLTDESNAQKAMSLLNSLTSSGTQIPSSSNAASMWLWCRNLVAQNAVIDNLFSNAITILSGGYIKGGDRYDSSGNVSDWSEKGFWFASDGTLKASLQSDDNNNTFVGTEISATSNIIGEYNTAVGYRALHSNITTGDYNIAVGCEALYSSSSARYNTAVGYQALYTATTGSYNNAIGYKVLYSNSTGYNNTAVGNRTLYTNSTGYFNVAVGNMTMYMNSSGYFNTAVGNSALYSNTTGTSNVAVGDQALYANTTGGNNVALGYSADVHSPTGSYQVNINDTIIVLRFRKGRAYSDIFTALSSYFSSGLSEIVGCFGEFNGNYVDRIAYDGSSTIYLYGGASVTLSSGDTSNTATSLCTLCFIQPNAADTSTSTADCLDT